MTREIGWLLIATAAACALWLVLLLAWHELSGRGRARRYRAQVSAARLAFRQEQRESDARLRAELDRRFGKTPNPFSGLSVEQLTAIKQNLGRD